MPLLSFGPEVTDQARHADTRAIVSTRNSLARETIPTLAPIQVSFFLVKRNIHFTRKNDTCIDASVGIVAPCETSVGSSEGRSKKRGVRLFVWRVSYRKRRGVQKRGESVFDVGIFRDLSYLDRGVKSRQGVTCHNWTGESKK